MSVFGSLRLGKKKEDSIKHVVVRFTTLLLSYVLTNRNFFIFYSVDAPETGVSLAMQTFIVAADNLGMEARWNSLYFNARPEADHTKNEMFFNQVENV